MSADFLLPMTFKVTFFEINDGDTSECKHKMLETRLTFVMSCDVCCCFSHMDMFIFLVLYKCLSSEINESSERGRRLYVRNNAAPEEQSVQVGCCNDFFRQRCGVFGLQ